MKGYNLTDCAVQAWVARGGGKRLELIRLAQVGSSFFYPCGGDDRGVLATKDATQRVRERLPQVHGWVARRRTALAGPCPRLEVGPHCRDPFDCLFFDHCTPPPLDYPLILVAAELIAEGILDVRDIQEERLTSPRHERIRALAVKGRAEVRPELVAILDSLAFPRA